MIDRGSGKRGEGARRSRIHAWPPMNAKVAEEKGVRHSPYGTSWTCPRWRRQSSNDVALRSQLRVRLRRVLANSPGLLMAWILAKESAQSPRDRLTPSPFPVRSSYCAQIASPAPDSPITPEE